METTQQYHLLLFVISLCFMILTLSNSTIIEGEKVVQKHHYIVQLSSLLPSSVCHASPQGATKEGSLRVVHKHGPCSQVISQGKVKPPTVEDILSQDQLRVNSIHSRVNSGKKDLQASASKVTIPANSGSIIGSGNYIIKVGLGTPKKDLNLIFDTGSSLTWTQCKPCARSCYDQQDPIFDPSSSKSYSNITCTSPLCSQLTGSTGISPGCSKSTSTCIYGSQYGDGSFSVGFFAKEKLSLTSSPRDVIDGYLFGCGQDNEGLFTGVAGLMGLGPDKLSLISQSSQKYGSIFSYCLPSRSSLTGYLTLGPARVNKSIKYTPLTGDASFYNIDTKAIIVGGKQLLISPTVFSTAGTIVDSGTVITRLPPDAYSALRTEFRAQMTKYPMTKAISILDTCYDFSNYTTILIPKISFVFGGNANVEISSSGILLGPSTSQVCLAFAGNGNASDSGIFGNTQQKTLQVVYDVAGGKLGFSAGGCS